MKIIDALRGVKQLAFDSTPLIYYIENNPVYFPRMQIIMSSVAAGQIDGIASFLALTEVLVHPFNTGDTGLAKQYESVLAKSRDFQLIPIREAIATKAAELRATYNLKTPDALHVASAIVAGCDAFLTNDTGIKRVKEITVLILGELET